MNYNDILHKIKSYFNTQIAFTQRYELNSIENHIYYEAANYKERRLIATFTLDARKWLVKDFQVLEHNQDTIRLINLLDDLKSSKTKVIFFEHFCKAEIFEVCYAS